MNTQITYIPVDRIHPHPGNPRKDLGDLTELAESIKARGIMQNLTVVPLREVHKNIEGKAHLDVEYTVVIGHRRLAAAKLTGLIEVPCVISEMDHKEQVATMLLENIQRSDLTPIEQAQGFQMMMDLGETVSGIAKKTGFSDATIQRRLNLVKLDQGKLMEAQARGGTLMDYAKLEQIKNDKKKNRLLQYIGTRDFDWQLKNAIDKQEEPERKKKLMDLLDTFAKKIKSTSEIKKGFTYEKNFHGFQMGDWKKPKDADKVKYYYTVDNWGISLYKEAPAAVKKELTPKEKDFNRREAEVKRLTKQAYELRLEFVRNFTAAKKYAKEIQDFVVLRLLGYNYPDTDDIFKAFAVDKDEVKDLSYNQVHEYKKSLVLDRYAKAPEKTLLLLAYAGCSDKPSNDYVYARGWENTIVYEKNENLDTLYNTLISLGYEMSTEEQQLRDGSHELFDKSRGGTEQ